MLDNQALQAGTVIDDRYIVRSEIARGGIAIVYLCTDRRLSRNVAVKIQSAEKNSAHFRRQLSLEAQSVAQLNHPNIVDVYDRGEYNGRPYIVMEYVPGGTLRQIIEERGVMSPRIALSSIRYIALALQLAHSHKMVHRDIKPQNILISANGELKLVDFGLVRMNHTSTNGKKNVIGTAAYLAPEYISLGESDARSDIYSLGIVLFELLTLSPPFSPAESDSQSTAYKHISEQIPPPSCAGTFADADTDNIVLKMLEKRPEDRYQDCSELIADIDRLFSTRGWSIAKVPCSRDSDTGRKAQQRTAGTRAHTQRTHTISTPTGSSREVPDQQAQTARTTVMGSGEPPTTQLRLPQVEPATSVIPSHQATTALPATQHTTVLPSVHPQPAVQPREDYPAHSVPTHTVQPGKSSGMGCMWIVVIFGAILALVALIVSWQLTSGRGVSIPQLSGNTVQYSAFSLEQLGLTWTTSPQASETIAENTVIGTDPGEGSVVSPGDRVIILVSSGLPVVPELGEDRSLSKVSQTISRAGLRLVKGPLSHSETIPSGQVISLDPVPGTRLGMNDNVTATISQGPAPITVPQLVGLTVDEANKALIAAGLQLGPTEHTFDANHDQGRVVSSSPEANTLIARGEKISLAVSNALTVPDLTGMTEQQARNALINTPFSLTVEGNTDRATIGRQEPAGGTRVAPDNTELRATAFDKVTVPLLVGKTVGSARAQLEKAGLTAQIEPGTPDSAFIIGQNPLPAVTTTAGARITLFTVS